MKKIIAIAVMMSALTYSTGANAKSFANCSALNQKYPAGVARSAAVAQKQKKIPFVSAKIYRANAKMDRDKDGTACEK